MKVLLINPTPNRDTDPFGAFTDKPRYPAGLHSISAVLAAHGFEAPVLDLTIEEIGVEGAIGREKPDVVGITAITPTRFDAIDAARRIREISPNTIIVVGGPHFTFTAEDTMTHVPEIDVVVRGEGEYAMLKLMQSLKEGSAPGGIEGISFRSNGRVTHNRDRPFIRDLDELPRLNWDGIPVKRYSFRFMGVDCGTISTSRGCPTDCVCCSATRMWGACTRRRSPGRVVDEIEYLLKRFDLGGVHFDDDMLTLSREHVLGICDEIGRRGLDFRWSCEVRSDSVDRSTLARMRSAGCYSALFGYEAGLGVLNSTRKRSVRNRIIRTVIDCKALGMQCPVCFIYSLPGETDHDRDLTLEFLEELIEAGIDHFVVRPAAVYPGTELETAARANGVLPADFSWSIPYHNERNKAVSQVAANTPLYTESLSLEGILEMQVRLNARRKAFCRIQSLQKEKGGLFRVCKMGAKYLLGFARVRSLSDLKKHLVLGRETMIAWRR